MVALETGGRRSPEFVEGLARARAWDSPPNQARSAFLAWRRRWYQMLSVSCAKAFATSLLFGALYAVSGAHGNVPEATDLHGEA